MTCCPYVKSNITPRVLMDGLTCLPSAKTMHPVTPPGFRGLGGGLIRCAIASSTSSLCKSVAAARILRLRRVQRVGGAFTGKKVAEAAGKAHGAWQEVLRSHQITIACRP